MDASSSSARNSNVNNSRKSGWNFRKLFPRKKSPRCNNIIGGLQTSNSNNNCNKDEREISNHRVLINTPEDLQKFVLSNSSTAQIPENFSIVGEIVIVLHGADNAKVYLIGTNHISQNSVIAVDVLIKQVQPHIVVTELDKSRTGMNKQSKVFSGNPYTYNYRFLRNACSEFNFIGGMIFFMMAFLETFVGRMFHVNWGADLRSPFFIVKGAIEMMPRDRFNTRPYEVMLGDRPIEVTFRRMALTLTSFQKSHVVLSTFLGIFFGMKCMCLKTAMRLNKHPDFESVLVHERDVYLTYSLQEAAKMKFNNEPTKVIGIVGKDHVPGIVKLWGTVTDQDLQRIMAT